MKRKLISLLLCVCMACSLLSAGVFAAPADAASLGDLSIEALPTGSVTGTVYTAAAVSGEEDAKTEWTVLIYVPDVENYGLRATATPILQVYGDGPFTAESAKALAESSGLAEIAYHEKGAVAFVNPLGENWAEADAPVFEAVKNLFSDGTNNAEPVSNFTEDGHNADGLYPGSYSRDYAFAFGAGADFVYEVLCAGVPGAGQFFGTASHKPTAVYLNAPASEKAVNLAATDDRRVPAVIVNGGKSVVDAFTALNGKALVTAVDAPDAEKTLDRATLLKAYDDVLEHYILRVESSGTLFNETLLATLLYLPTAAELGLKETKDSYAYKDATLNYYLWTPASGSAGKPLVVTMHGSANSAEAQAWTSDLYLLAAKYDFSLLSLENYSNDNIDSAMLLEAIQAVAAKLGADQTRVYCSGFSMGSRNTWDLTEKYSDYFAGAIGMALFMGKEEEVSFAHAMPFYLIAGEGSYIAAMEFPNAERQELPALLAANGVIASAADFQFDAGETWGIKADKTYEIDCPDLPRTSGVASVFPSADGVVRTIFVCAVNAGHEPVGGIVADAVQFILQFSRVDGESVYTPAEGAAPAATEPAPAVEIPPAGYVDVPADAWYAGAVDGVTYYGVMVGVGDQKFDPEGSLTRAMLVQILWRLEDKPEPAGVSAFVDVPADAWYAKAVAWAQENGIVTGIAENAADKSDAAHFDPDGILTREMLAAIFYRRAVQRGFDTAYDAETVSGIQASAWAEEAVKWAAANGMLTPRPTDGDYCVADEAGRGQVALFVSRFCQTYM